MRLTILAIITLLLAGCEQGLKPVSFESERGSIQYKERVVSDGGRSMRGIRQATEAELASLRRSADRAPAFIETYVLPSARNRDLLENLDASFAAWLNSSSSNKESPAEVEAIVGAALGQYCIERLPVHWAVDVDPRGTEFVLVGENPPSKSYPLVSVRYRIEDRQSDFVGALYEALVHIRKKAS